MPGHSHDSTGLKVGGILLSEGLQSLVRFLERDSRFERTVQIDTAVFSENAPLLAPGLGKDQSDIFGIPIHATQLLQLLSRFLDRMERALNVS
jgi:hypothetical protein